jgi:hypothetical protein
MNIFKYNYKFLKMLLLLFIPIVFAMPVIDLGIDDGGWDNVPSSVSSIVPLPFVASNPLPTPLFETPILPPSPLPPPFSPINYDLGVVQVSQYQVPQVQVPQFQIPQVQVPQFQIPQVQVPQFQIPQVQVPQFQIPQVQVPQVPQVPVQTTVETPQPTGIVPPPITFPNAD